MKEYFNSFDDIPFFHTFSSISRDMKIVTLNEIHRYIQNFMLYKMIYFSSHKFAFSNLRFSPFYEHFRQLREKLEVRGDLSINVEDKKSLRVDRQVGRK